METTEPPRFRVGPLGQGSLDLAWGASLARDRRRSRPLRSRRRRGARGVRRGARGAAARLPAQPLGSHARPDPGVRRAGLAPLPSGRDPVRAPDRRGQDGAQPDAGARAAGRRGRARQDRGGGDHPGRALAAAARATRAGPGAARARDPVAGGVAAEGRPRLRDPRRGALPASGTRGLAALRARGRLLPHGQAAGACPRDRGDPVRPRDRGRGPSPAQRPHGPLAVREPAPADLPPAPHRDAGPERSGRAVQPGHAAPARSAQHPPGVPPRSRDPGGPATAPGRRGPAPAAHRRHGPEPSRDHRGGAHAPGGPDRDRGADLSRAGSVRRAVGVPPPELPGGWRDHPDDGADPPDGAGLEPPGRRRDAGAPRQRDAAGTPPP